VLLDIRMPRMDGLAAGAESAGPYRTRQSSC